MSIEKFLLSLEDWPISSAIRDGDVLFPWIESVHVLAIVLVVGVISIVDLRLIGFRAHELSARRLLAQTLPLTWIAFAFAVTTGVLLFASQATTYSRKLPFLIKMGLLLLAGANMAYFHLVTIRNVASWDTQLNTPPGVKAAGLVSLSLWAAIVVCGRWIGFVEN